MGNLESANSMLFFVFDVYCQQYNDGFMVRGPRRDAQRATPTSRLRMRPRVQTGCGVELFCSWGKAGDRDRVDRQSDRLLLIVLLHAETVLSLYIYLLSFQVRKNYRSQTCCRACKGVFVSICGVKETLTPVAAVDGVNKFANYRQVLF